MTARPIIQKMSDYPQIIQKRTNALKNPTCTDKCLSISACTLLYTNTVLCFIPECTLLAIITTCYGVTCCGFFENIPKTSYFCIRHYSPGACCHRNLFYLFHRILGASSRFFPDFPNGGYLSFCLGISEDSFDVNTSLIDCAGLDDHEMIPEFIYTSALREEYLKRFEKETQSSFLLSDENENPYF